MVTVDEGVQVVNVVELDLASASKKDLNMLPTFVHSQPPLKKVKNHVLLKRSSKDLYNE